MNNNLFNVRRHRWWCLFPLLVLLWNGLYVVGNLSPQYFFFICYPANLMIIVGIAAGIGSLIGIGLGWAIIAFPLYLYDSFHLSNWVLSCAFFHITGLLIGLMALKEYRLPRHIWFPAVFLGLIMQMLSRRFTDESLNINAAFRVYDGWEGIYTDYSVYRMSMLIGFALFFYGYALLSNRIFHGDPVLLKSKTD